MSHDFSVKFSSSITKLKDGKWVCWSQEAGMALRQQRAWRFVDGTEKELTAITEKTEWLATNEQIVGALGTIVEPALQRELEKISNAKAAWDKLKEKTHSRGIIAKLKSITSAIRNHTPVDTPTCTTITEIKDGLSTIFEGGGPTQEEWLIVLLLKLLWDGEYDWLRKDLLRFMMNSKMQITSDDIIE